MYPGPFEYRRVQSVEEAVTLLGEHPGAELLAGGQSLIPLQKLRLAAPDVLIDLNHLESLDYITDDGDEIAVGALARHTAVERAAPVRDHLSLFSECISQIADWQVRNQGTVGGTIVEADPSGDYFPVLTLLDPEIVIEGPDGRRTIAFSDFYLGMFTVDLDHEEVVTEVRFPKLTPVDGATALGSTYAKHAARSGDYAIVGEAAILHVDADGVVVDANLAVGAVGPLFRAEEAESIVEGTTVGDDVLADAADAVREQAEPDEEGREGAYRQDMAGVFAKRALSTAYERATGAT